MPCEHCCGGMPCPVQVWSSNGSCRRPEQRHLSQTRSRRKASPCTQSGATRTARMLPRSRGRRLTMVKSGETKLDASTSHSRHRPSRSCATARHWSSTSSSMIAPGLLRKACRRRLAASEIAISALAQAESGHVSGASQKPASPTRCPLPSQTARETDGPSAILSRSAMPWARSRPLPATSYNPCSRINR